MASVGQRRKALRIVAAVAEAALKREGWITYRALDRRITSENATGQSLRVPLDIASELCRLHGFPDVATVVVTAESLRAGRPSPSRGAFHEDGTYGPSRLDEQQLRAVQSAVFDFDWTGVDWDALERDWIGAVRPPPGRAASG